MHPSHVSLRNYTYVSTITEHIFVEMHCSCRQASLCVCVNRSFEIPKEIPCSKYEINASSIRIYWRHFIWLFLSLTWQNFFILLRFKLFFSDNTLALALISINENTYSIFFLFVLFFKFFPSFWRLYDYIFVFWLMLQVMLSDFIESFSFCFVCVYEIVFFFQ